jgi:hypothetical protein
LPTIGLLAAGFGLSFAGLFPWIKKQVHARIINKK